MIYVPNYSASTYPCVVVQNATTIRAYKQAPYNPPQGQGNISIAYRDFYYTSNYTFTDSNQSFSYSSTLPSCLSQSTLTNEFYYRNDFDSILIVFLIMCIFIFLVPGIILKKFIKR